MKKSMLIIGAAVLMLTNLCEFHPKLFAQAGSSTVPFLLISPDARTSGMGEAGTAIADDINAIYWNPAGLGFLDYFPKKNPFDEDEELRPFRQVALSFSPWLPQFNADLFYSYGTIGQYFDFLQGTVVFNFIFMNLGEFNRTSETGQSLGKFISNEYALGLSYGTIIASDLSIGAQLRYIQSNLTPTLAGQQDAGNGNSVSFDVGLLWKPQNLPLIQDRVSLGFNLKNIGPKITYIHESDPLPTTLNLGLAVTVVKDEYNDLKIAGNFSKLLVRRDQYGADPLPKSLITGWKNPGASWSFGTEYWYNQIIAIRAGYFTEPSRVGGRQYWNFGVGVKYNIFHVDFSFINTIEANHPLANTMRISFLIDWR